MSDNKKRKEKDREPEQMTTSGKAKLLDGGKALIDDGMLKEILSWVGPGCYRYIGAINRRFNVLYKNGVNGGKCTTNEAGFTFSIPWAEMFLAETGNNGRDRLCRSAAATGNRDLAHWAVAKKECRLDEMSLLKSAKCGHLDFLKWAVLFQPEHLDENTINLAAGGGHLAVVQWLRCKEDPCDWSVRTSHAAALGGHIHVLEWIRSGQGGGICPWDKKTCRRAARGKQLEKLKWLGIEDTEKWLGSEEWRAARGKQLDTLKWLRSKECPWDIATMNWAINNEDLEMVKWARNNGCPWDDMNCAMMARNRTLEMLEWARSQEPKIEWDALTPLHAAEAGKFETLKWLRSQDPPCPWDADTTRAIAEKGRLDTLQWARDPNTGGGACPWDGGVIFGAINREVDQSFHREAPSWDILRWAVENGCPMDAGACIAAVDRDDFELLKWLRSKGCPWNQHVANACRVRGRHRREMLDWVLENGCPPPED